MALMRVRYYKYFRWQREEGGGGHHLHPCTTSQQRNDRASIPMFSLLLLGHLYLLHNQSQLCDAIQEDER